MRVVVTPADPPAEPLTFDDLASVVIGRMTPGAVHIDALILRFIRGTEVVTPLAHYVSIEILEDVP